MGIGNQLMMDDGIGIYLVEELSKQNERSDIRYIVGESDIDYCLEQIQGAVFVIIIDAVVSGKYTGELSIYPLEVVVENQTLHLSPHNLHLFQVLYLMKDKVKGYLIGVEPDRIEFQIGLSQKLKEKWNFVLKKTKYTIEKIVENEVQLE